MSEEQESSGPAGNLIREILAALRPKGWSAEELAELQSALEAGKYEGPDWLRGIDLEKWFREKHGMSFEQWYLQNKGCTDQPDASSP